MKMSLFNRRSLITSLGLLKRNITPFLNKFTKTEYLNVNIKYPQLPERFKGTIVEKWADYWKNLLHDYREVIKDTALATKNQPKKTAAFLTVFGIGMYCAKKNPNELSYRDAVISASGELMLIGPSIRNPIIVQYLKEIESGYNEGTIHLLSLGLFSVIWRGDYNEYVGIYKSQCEYLGFPFFRFYERIIDIGFLNKWFILEKNMVDYDINPDEWDYLNNV